MQPRQKHKHSRVTNSSRIKRLWAVLITSLVLLFLDGLVSVDDRHPGLDIVRCYVLKSAYYVNVLDAMFVPVKMDGYYTKMLLDTAANPSAIFLFKASVKMDFAGVRDTRIGLGHSVKTLSVSIFWVNKDFIRFDQGGVLGVDFFAGERIIIDPRLAVLAIDHDPHRPRYQTKPTSVSLPCRDSEEGKPVVSCFTNGGIKPFLVDTGASGDFYVPESVYQHLPARPKGLFEGRVFGIRLKPDGRYIQGWARVHPRARNSYLLGSGFLFRYKMTLDFRDKMLYLEPPG